MKPSGQHLNKAVKVVITTMRQTEIVWHDRVQWEKHHLCDSPPKVWLASWRNNRLKSNQETFYKITAM